MKVPKFLLYLVPAFIVICFARALLGAGPFDLAQLMVYLDEVELDFADFINIFDVFGDGTFVEFLYTWDETLTGIDGFFYNLTHVLSGFFTAVWQVISGFVLGLWQLTVDVLAFTRSIFRFVFAVLGFSVAI